ncbi:MAG: putative O-glycosylation ligase, exosortase system-associated, partial [Belnapia sp.]|nr:putative O-glycosylation ligase, exosortase system-associated [Belnapia sp.]
LAFGATILGCFVAREPKRVPTDAVTWLLLALLVGITLTTTTALGDPDAAWDIWARTSKVILGLFLTAALLTDRWRVHALIWAMVLSIGYFGIRGGLFTLANGGQYIVMGPPSTMITDRNHLAVAMLVVVPLMSYLRSQSPHRWVRLGLAVAMVLTVFAVVGSQSRGALIGLAGAAGMLWLRSSGKVGSGLAIVACVAGAILFMPASWTERMNTIQSYEADGSAMGRVTIWMTALDIALSRPLVGGGFRAVYQQPVVDRYTPGTTARATHSIWFEVLGEHGFLIFFIWLGIIGAGVWYSLQIVALARGQPQLAWAAELARMAQVSIVAYVLGGSFLSLSYWDLFWTIMVVLGATHALVRQAVWQTVRRPQARAGFPAAAALR